MRTTKRVALAIWLTVLVVAAFAGGRQIRWFNRTVFAGNAQMAGPMAGLPGSGTPFADEADSGDPADTLRDVLAYVYSEYVDKVGEPTKLADGAVRSMAFALDDPRTRFYDAKQWARFQRQLSGEFEGIGAFLTVGKVKKGAVEQRRLRIIAPAPGGPADVAGVRAGDVVTEIDGRWVIAYDPRLDLNNMQTREMDDRTYRQAFKDATKRLTDGMTLGRALDRLNGLPLSKATPDPADVKLTLERQGSPKPIKVTVHSAAYTLDPVSETRLDGVACLRITQFNERAEKELGEALAAAGTAPVVIDLRNNAGGPVADTRSGAYAAAATLVGLLTDGGSMGSVVRSGGRKQPLPPAAERAKPRRLAVVVNGGTAGLAEVAAAALRDQGGARLVGSRSMGDGTYQKLVPLRAGGALTISAGKFLTDKGASIEGVGLKPDMAVPESEDPVRRAAGALAQGQER